MHLYKRGKRWWIEYIIGGVKHRESTGATKKSEAETWMRNIQTARKMPSFEHAVEVLKILFAKACDGVIPLSDAWSQYERLAKAVGKLAVSAHTIRTRKALMAAFVEWAGKHAGAVQTIEAVNGAVAAKFAQHLADIGNSTKTRRNKITELSTMWGILEKLSPAVRNPWQHLAPIVTDGKRIPPFSLEQEEAVLKAAKQVGKDWWPACVIARHTGLRYGDVAHLMWDEIDLDAGVIRHRPRKTKKYKIVVTLPIIAPMREAIESLKRRGPYLFPLHAHLYGDRGRKSREALSFGEVLDAAGLDRNEFTFHSWRHTAATRLAEAGADKDTRKALLGHTTDENAERYDHADHLAELTAAVEAAATR